MINKECVKMDLSVDLEALVEEELKSLQSTSHDTLKIPLQLISRYMGSYFFAQLESGMKLKTDSVKTREKYAKAEEKHQKNFEKLYQSVPHVPDLSLRVLSLAYGALGALYGPGLEGVFIENNELEIIRSLMISSQARGIAETAFSLALDKKSTVDEEQKLLISASEAVLASFKKNQSQKLSEAGRLGAQAKNLQSNKLKEWALDKAVSMRGDDRNIARKLSAQLPLHLADASTDPIRLIYETLRAKRKLN